MASGRAIKAGKAAIELFLDDNLARRQLRTFARRFRAVGLGLAGIGAAATGLGASITAPFLGAIKAAGDFNETLNQFRETFGEQSGAAEQFADEFGNQVGRAKGELLGFLALGQSNLLQLGLDESRTRELSQQLTSLAVDLGSFYNVADQEAFGRLISGLNGSSEALEKFSIDIKQANLEAKLLSQGIKFSEATEAEKRLARLAIILESTTDAQGDAARTSDSFSNQLKAVGANIQETAVAIGQVFIPAAEQLLGAVNDNLAPMQEWVNQNQGLVIAAAASGAGLIALGVALGGVGIALTTAAAGFSILATAVGTIGAPALIVIGALSGIAIALIDWEQAWQSSLDFIESDVKPALEGIGTFLNSQDYSAAGELLVLSLEIGLRKGWEKVKATIAEIIAGVGTIGVLVPDGIIDPKGIENAINSFDFNDVDLEAAEKRRDALIANAKKTQVVLDKENAERAAKAKQNAAKREADAAENKENIEGLFEDIKSGSALEDESKNAFDIRKHLEFARDAVKEMRLPGVEELQTQISQLQFNGGVEARSTIEGELADRILGTESVDRVAEANLNANERSAEQIELLNEKITNNVPVFGVA